MHRDLDKDEKLIKQKLQHDCVPEPDINIYFQSIADEKSQMQYCPERERYYFPIIIDNTETRLFFPPKVITNALNFLFSFYFDAPEPNASKVMLYAYLLKKHNDLVSLPDWARLEDIAFKALNEAKNTLDVYRLGMAISHFSPIRHYNRLCLLIPRTFNYMLPTVNANELDNLIEEITEGKKEPFNKILQPDAVITNKIQPFFKKIREIQNLINEVLQFPIVPTSLIVDYLCNIDPSWKGDIQNNSSSNQLVEISSHESTLFGGKSTPTRHSRIQRSSSCHF